MSIVTTVHNEMTLLPLLEYAPSLIFFSLLRSSVDLETAGWAGAALAVIVLITLRIGKLRFDPILLGINVHLLVITPLIVVLSRFGAPRASETLIRYSHQGVLVTILLIGVMLTMLSRQGFIGLEDLSRPTVRRYSAVLLAACLAATVWALTYAGGALIGTTLPVVGLFGLRRLLVSNAELSSKSE